MVGLGARRSLTALPKAQLHLHLTGSLRPSTLQSLAERYQLELPPPLDLGDPARIHQWPEFQQRYDAARTAIRTPADVARVVSEAAADDAADGCGWLEIQVDPTSFAPVLGGLRPALEAVLDAAAAAVIPAGVIVASSWARPAGHAELLAGLAAEYAGRGVVGFGLSNDERLGRPADFAAAFGIAAAAGLLTTPHAGFYTGADHVAECVRVLGATRIGHGTAAATDPATMALLAERGVALEVCPTSYPPFGVHPLDGVPVLPLMAAGVPVVLASDDPLLFGTGLAGQYAICRDTLGLSDDQLALLAGNSIRYSAAPAELKRRLLSSVDSWLVEVRHDQPSAL